MKTRDDIILMMCYTCRHDYGLPRDKDPAGYSFPYTAGMTNEERDFLWREMAQLFDNCIDPYMEFRDDSYSN